MNISRHEQLEKSVEHYEKALAFHKSQTKYSLSLFGGGLVLFGAGVVGITAGSLEAVSAFPVSGLMTYMGQASLRRDFQDTLQAQSRLAVRQHELELELQQIELSSASV